MNLKEKINQDIQQAILSKDTDKLAALRAVKSAILNKVSYSIDLEAMEIA